MRRDQQTLGRLRAYLLTGVGAAILIAYWVSVHGEAAAVDQLTWMAGCWRQDAGVRVVDEMWMAPSGGAMLGVSRTIVGQRAVAHEFMQIREDGGRVIFVARPSGQPEATFTLVQSAAGEVVFENPQHDFPQRVIYRRAEGGLTGRIEGTQNGKPRSAEFPMRRVACPS
jgi:hypothetical protein